MEVGSKERRDERRDVLGDVDKLRDEVSWLAVKAAMRAASAIWIRR